MGPSLVGQHWGEALQANMTQQTENPDASYDNTANPQIDPDTAAVVMDRYFEKQSQLDAPAQEAPSIIQFTSD
jgi:type IV pilus biogenesis protein CpaD/CtpE